MADLTGKVAIVTGGARGIGRAYAEALANAGAAVLVADLLETEGQATAEAIRAKGQQAAFQSVNVADQAATEAMAKAAADAFGGVDILVNNAAIFASLRGGPMLDIPTERWDRVMSVNVRGPWLCICAVVPYMRERGGGAIVNQTSTTAFGSPGMVDYAVSKTAVIGLTKSAALELGRDNIRVNAIAPGGVATEGLSEILGGDLSIMEQRAKSTQLIARQMIPADMAATVVHLVSDGAGFITGQTIVIDGGKYFLG